MQNKQNLPNSIATRYGGDAPTDSIDTGYSSSVYGDQFAGIGLKFDLGTAKKHEIIHVHISPLDYSEILSQMIFANRKAFFEALANTLLQHAEELPASGSS